MLHLTPNVRPYTVNEIVKAFNRTLHGEWLETLTPIHVRSSNVDDYLLPANVAETLAAIVLRDECGEKKLKVSDSISLTWNEAIECLRVLEAGINGRVVIDGRHTGAGDVLAFAVMQKHGLTPVNRPQSAELSADCDEYETAVRLNLVHNESRGMNKEAVFASMFDVSDGRTFNSEADCPVPKTLRGMRQVVWRWYWLECQLRKAKKRSVSQDELLTIKTFSGLQEVYKKYIVNNKKTPKAKELGLLKTAQDVNDVLRGIMDGTSQRETPILKADSIRELANEANKVDATSTIAVVLQSIVDNDNNAAETAIAAYAATIG